MTTADRGMRWPVDVAVTVVVAVLTAMDAWWNQPGTRNADAWTYVLVAVSVGAVLGRRRWPLLAAVVCAAALTAWYVLGHRGELLSLPTMVSLYTVAARAGRQRKVLVGAVAVMWSAGLGWIVDGWSTAPVAQMLGPVAALLLGEVVRGRRELMAEYAAREARAAADRERDADRRVAQDRLRIAREFHDVVAHTLAAVNVQMSVAVAAFDRRPDAARAALVQARASSREALQELRATVTLLRDGVPGDPTAPAPHLGQLDDLVARANGAGVSVSLHRDTGGCDVPAVVELTAYRVVQEALTNVIRHADAHAAEVTVICGADAVTVQVTDDGTASCRLSHHPGLEAAEPRGGGYGLTGMTERVAAIGGRLEFGPLPDGGFRVYAVLPAGAGMP